MQYLLDTHCLIWFLEDNPKIPTTVIQELQNPSNEIFFSQVSLFEIAIKQKIGKLPSFQASITDVYEQALKADFTYSPIKNSHIEAYATIPLLTEHRDPFDRLLLATAHTENLTVCTIDKNFSLYSDLIKVLW